MVDDQDTPKITPQHQLINNSSTILDTKITVAITGATGFVGRHILPILLNQGHKVRALVRNPERMTINHHNLTKIPGHIQDRQSLKNLLHTAQSVIHLVGIIMEIPRKGQTFDRIHRQGTENLLDIAQDTDIQHFIHMSALGTRQEAVSTYHKTKYLAEQAVLQSKIPYTIFRPSIIHGPDGEFIQMINHFCTGLFPPFIPYFAPGLFGTRSKGGLVQPIYIDDLAKCFADAVTNPKVKNEIYPMAGPDKMTLPQMYETCKKHLPGARNKNPRAIPVWYAKIIAGKPFVPFNKDQVIMSQENSTTNTAKLEADFNITLAHFEQSFALYAAKI